MLFFYLLLWLIFSLRLGVQVTVTGLILAVIVYRFTRVHMRYKRQTDFKLLRKLFLIIKYALTVILETAKSSIIVIRIVFSRTIKVEPCIIYFRTSLKSSSAQTVLANSITLTPGTITVAVDDGLFCVHCLKDTMAEGIEDSVFVRQLRKIEE